MADDNVTFDEPEGFVPPENLDSDDQFQAMATFKVLPDNQLQLVDIEGYQVGEGEEEEGEEAEPGESAAAAGGAAAAAGTAGPNMSEDRLAPAANQTTVGPSFAQQLTQRFRREAMRSRRR